MDLPPSLEIGLGWFMDLIGNWMGTGNWWGRRAGLVGVRVEKTGAGGCFPLRPFHSSM